MKYNMNEKENSEWKLLISKAGALQLRRRRRSLRRAGVEVCVNLQKSIVVIYVVYIKRKNMKKILCFIIIIGFSNCQKNTNRYLCQNEPLVPKDNIYAVLDSFVKENNDKNYIYELYIDKKTPHDYVLTIYCGENSLTVDENKHNEQMPVNYTIVSGKKFSIYSGVEHYFTKENNTIVDTIVNERHEKNIWIVKDNYDTISIYKGLQFSYPFTPLPANFPNEVFNPLLGL